MTAEPIYKINSFISHGDAYKTLTQTQFRDCSIARESFENGKEAYAAHNYTKAIESYTRTIESLTSNLSMVLMHRAAAFEMKNKYDLAFLDGQRAINNINITNIANDSDNISSVRDAYVTTSNVLIHKNQLKEAASKYQQALEIIPSTSTHHLELVQRHRQVTIEIQNRNIWLIQYLPHEVISRIISFLSFSERGQLALTCRFWCNFILDQYSDMWRTIDPMDPKFPTQLTSIQRSLRSVVPHRVGKVKLYLENKRNATTRRDAQNSYNNVEMLTNDDDYNKQCNVEYRSKMIFSTIFERNWNSIPKFEFVNPNKQQVCDILRLNSRSVKYLKFINNIDNGYHEEALIDAVQVCSGLVSVTSQMNKPAPSILCILYKLPASNLCLTTLELLCEMTTHSFAQLLRNTPSLTNLLLDANKMRQYAETLNIIITHCPALNTLSYKTQNLPDYSHLTTYTAYPPIGQAASASSTKGLKMLDFSILYHGTETDHEANDQALETLFKNSRDSLDYLKIGLREASIANCRSLSSLVQFGMPHLRQLLIDIPEFQVQHFGSRQLAKLILGCPSLEMVNIWRGCGIWHDRVLYALATLRNLDSLIISAEHVELFCYGPNDRREQYPDYESVISNRGMEALISGARSMTKFSFYAGDIDVYYYPFMKELASIISARSNIHELNIGFGEITNDQLVQILRRLKGSQVRILKTDVSEEIDDKVIKVLADLSITVEELFIQDPFGDISKSQLAQLLDQASYPFNVKIKIRQNSYMKGSKPDTTETIYSQRRIHSKIITATNDEEDPYAKYAIQQYYDEEELDDLRCGVCGQISAINYH
ncbi:hypothetical protein INT45_011012 [Circinella minor]|uniref:F-box domain-containing protein n=1 Tax=Circinella minor TaxID=1195481 RepID=A0A8H7SEM9_9FUNG|nr:hypothetical protein INT45_011012 [Circinella minor]